MGKYKLYQGDCLEVMKNIEDGSVDLNDEQSRQPGAGGEGVER